MTERRPIRLEMALAGRGNHHAGQLGGGHEPADRRVVDPDGLEVEIEVDPVEAERRSKEQGGQEESACVPTEIR